MLTSHEIKYYIQGLGRLTKPVLKLLAVVACSSRVSEEPLRMTQEDDRIGKRAPEIRAEMYKQADAALDMPEDQLTIMAHLGDMSVMELRNEVSLSVAVQVSYSERRLRQFDRNHWPLTRGNVLQNLRDHRAKPEKDIDGEVALRIRKLLQFGGTP